MRPMMDAPVRIDRDALVLGYAGVYSSFLLFAKRAGEKYGVSSRDILVELGASSFEELSKDVLAVGSFDGVASTETLFANFVASPSDLMA